MIFKMFIIPFIFLIGVSLITGLTRSLQILGRIRIKKEFKCKPYFYLFYLFIKQLFPINIWDNLFYLFSFTKNLLQILFATTCFYYIISLMSPINIEVHAKYIGLTIIIILVISLFLEFLIRSATNINPLIMLKIATPISTFFLFLFCPITFFCLKMHKILFHKKKVLPAQNKVKDKILELLEESELSTLLEPLDRRLITSVASFRDRIVREIMVPRINIFCLSVNQTVHEAAQKFLSEGYSRIPIYRETTDNIEGVLLCKDVMEYYFMCIEKKDTSPLETPLEHLIKPVLYAPETKKISHLLQEIRNQQIHLVIVVDEYGGTEGIVTIEDILEEIVGEIADEYDVVDDEKLYTPYPAGGWIVDAKMTIIDIEKELNIFIPQSSEYDTLGGFVFYRAGTIPLKGWKIHNNNFDLEVLSSSERSLKKIILIPSGH